MKVKLDINIESINNVKSDVIESSGDYDTIMKHVAKLIDTVAHEMQKYLYKKKIKTNIDVYLEND